MFGASGDLPLDGAIVTQGFQQLATQISEATGLAHTPEAVAAGCTRIAVQNMANVSSDSVQRGYDVTDTRLPALAGPPGSMPVSSPTPSACTASSFIR